MEFKGILVVDFGGQYNQLIARRVREASVYCEIVPYTKCLEKVKESRPMGIIFTGGPASVYEEGAPTLPKELFEMGIPILGICYGAQLMAHVLGGEVLSPDYKEYGRVKLMHGSGSESRGCSSLLFGEIADESICWMSHTDYIKQVPEGFVVSSFTENCPTGSMEHVERKL